jgi:hypothetical protein
LFFYTHNVMVQRRSIVRRNVARRGSAPRRRVRFAPKARRGRACRPARRARAPSARRAVRRRTRAYSGRVSQTVAAALAAALIVPPRHTYPQAIPVAPVVDNSERHARDQEEMAAMVSAAQAAAAQVVAEEIDNPTESVQARLDRLPGKYDRSVSNTWDGGATGTRREWYYPFLN